MREKAWLHMRVLLPPSVPSPWPRLPAVPPLHGDCGRRPPVGGGGRQAAGHWDGLPRLEPPSRLPRRLSEVARIKAAKDAAAAAAKVVVIDGPAPAPPSAPLGLSLQQLEPLLDRWSLGRVVQVADEALTRK